MSTWLFDLGNTGLKLACWRDGRLEDMQRVDHDGVCFAADWTERLPSRFHTAWIASVGPAALTVELIDALTARGRRISIARTQQHFAGMRIAYANPARFGVDRFLALLAAHARGVGPWLVVGIGTALTIDLIDAAGVHRGGRIAPSPTLMRESLHARAPHLPLAGGTNAMFADDTDSALASGCEGAALALIEQSQQAAVALLGGRPRVLLHGGGAAALAPALPDAIMSPSLVLEGLAQWSSVLAPTVRSPD
jgi:type III pantothenate kinase